MNWMSSGKKLILGIATVLLTASVLNSVFVDSTLLSQNCTISLSERGHALQIDTKQTGLLTDCIAPVSGTVNWFDWIGGKSSSYQFHFLDLLELLHGDDVTYQPVPQGEGRSI
jgi:hypothetical protein